MKVKCHLCGYIFPYDPSQVTQPKELSSTFRSKTVDEIPPVKNYVTNCPNCGKPIKIPQKPKKPS